MSLDALFGRFFFILVCAAALTWHAQRTPLNNWDMIGYVAAARSNAGLSGEALRDAVYGEVRDVVSPRDFALLTQPQGYRRDVFTDPAALEQQLPFYKIRVAYVWLIEATGDLFGGLARATQYVSAISAGLLTALLGLAMTWGRFAMPGSLFYLCFPVLALSSGLLGLGRLSTPDALASVVAFSALALLHQARLLALVLIAVIPLFRTDFIVLTGLLFAFLALERNKAVPQYGFLGVSVAVFAAVMLLVDHYGYLTVFNFTLVPGAITPFPAALEISTDPAVYLDVYASRALAMLGTPTPLMLLAAAMAAFADRRLTGEIRPGARTALLAAAFIVIHFGLFPLGATRHYAFALLIAGAFLLSLLASLGRGGEMAPVASSD